MYKRLLALTIIGLLAGSLAFAEETTVAGTSGATPTTVEKPHKTHKKISKTHSAPKPKPRKKAATK